MANVNWKRVTFWSLLFWFIYTAPTEGETAVVRVNVSPKVAFINPYKRTTFRFRWQIEPHEDNRRYAVSYTCGSEIHSSQGNVDGDSHPRTTERYVELTVVADCQFQACVVRIVDGKAKTICDYETIRTPKEDEP